MSTSCNQPWPADIRRHVQSFQYPVIASSPGGPITAPDGVAEDPRKRLDQALQQAQAAALQTALDQGRREGAAQAKAAAEQALEQSRLAVASALQEFSRQRAEYFHGVEAEVVRLAMAIAQKVLHREAQMDPLLLAGVVRVALDRMQDGTRVVLKTNPEHTDQWRHYLQASLPDSQQVEVVADTSLEKHACVLQTEVGSTEISVGQQLEEIELGFFDRLAKHSGEAS